MRGLALYSGLLFEPQAPGAATTLGSEGAVRDVKLGQSTQHQVGAAGGSTVAVPRPEPVKGIAQGQQEMTLYNLHSPTAATPKLGIPRTGLMKGLADEKEDERSSGTSSSGGGCTTTCCHRLERSSATAQHQATKPTFHP